MTGETSSVKGTAVSATATDGEHEDRMKIDASNVIVKGFMALHLFVMYFTIWILAQFAMRISDKGNIQILDSLMDSYNRRK